MAILDDDEVMRRIRGLICYGRNQTHLAREIGVSRVFVSNVLSGRSPPSPKILALIGVERRTVYVETGGAKSGGVDAKVKP